MAANTLADLLAAVRFDLDRGDQYDDRIRKAIRNQVQLLRGRRYTFNVIRDPLVLSGEYVTLPDYVMEVDAVNVNFGSYRADLEERNDAFMRRRARDPDFTGQPYFFAVVRNGQTKQLRLYPPPDATLSATLICQADLVKQASLSASWSDGVALGWFDDGFLMMKYAALAEMEGNVIGGPEGQAKAQQYAGQTVLAESELAMIKGNEAHSDTVKPCM